MLKRKRVWRKKCVEIKEMRKKQISLQPTQNLTIGGAEKINGNKMLLFINKALDFEK